MSAVLGAVLSAVLSAVWSPRARRYHPQQVLDNPAQVAAKSPHEEGGASSRTRGLAVHFLLTYVGYAALLAARKPFSQTKHRLQSDLGLSSAQVIAI